MDIEIKQKHPNLKKYILIGAAAAAAAITGIAAYKGVTTSTYHDSSNSVMIGEVTQGEFNDYVRMTGRVETGMIVQVSALESGIVERKWVEEGAMVQPGDIILTLHNPNLRQQILDSESQLAEKQNMLRDTELAMEKDRLQVRQDLLTTRTDLTRKRRLMEQQKALYDEGLTSREEYLKASEDYELAAQSFDLLRDRLRQDSLYRSVQLDMMRESLRNMQENFMLVRSRADNLTIRASHAGQLGSLNAEIGQNISTGSQVGQINILDSYKVTVSIDEHYIDRVNAGITGTMKRGGKSWPVTVSKVYPEVAESKFRADLTIDGSLPENLRVGQSFSVDLRLGDSEQAVMVPRGTFFTSTGGRWAYVLDADGHSATRRDIKIGRQNPEYYEVTEGLEPGERIIISSYSAYGDADRVTIAQ